MRIEEIAKTDWAKRNSSGSKIGTGTRLHGTILDVVKCLAHTELSIFRSTKNSDYI